MRFFLMMLIVALYAEANVYYAKAEPVESYTIKANVSGRVIFSASALEGKNVDNRVIIKLDDELDSEELKSQKLKLEALLLMEGASKENFKNLDDIAKLKEIQYERVKDLQTKAQVSKEADLSALMSAKASAISAKSSLYNLQTQILETRFKIKDLEDTIKNKTIKLNKLTLYALHVKEFDYVTTGTTLAQAYDLSKAKLTIYVGASDVEDLRSKKIYIDGEPSDAKIDRMWRVADVKNISSYEVRILIPAPQFFSKLVRIEFK